MTRHFELIGAPTSAGAHGPGQEKAPAGLRSAGLIETLRRLGLELTDGGDLPVTRFAPDPLHRSAQSADRVTSIARQVADRVAAAVERGRVLLVLGGDCTITLGVISGLLRAGADDLGLLYMDGDVDMNTPAISRSGILDNMGIAHVIGTAATPLRDIGPRRPLLPDERIAIFGYEPAEQEPAQLRALEGRAFHRYPSVAVRPDPPAAAARALAELERGAQRLLLHFDVDVVDTTELPLADFPHFNSGLSLDQAMACLQAFLAAPALAAFVITEINPDHDPEGAILRDFVPRLAQSFIPPPP